jgi:hypothetical protein
MSSWTDARELKPDVVSRDWLREPAFVACSVSCPLAAGNCLVLEI